MPQDWQERGETEQGDRNASRIKHLSGIPNFHFGIVQGFDYRHEQHVDFIALQPCEEDPTVYRRQGSNSDERVDRNVY